VAIFAPVLTAWEGQNFSDFNTDLVDQYGFPTIGTNSQHWFGVEPKTGRDLFSQWVYGARPSLEISAVAALTSSIIGVTAGLIAGFSGGWIDRSISWVVDFVLSLPYLLVAIAIIPVAVNWRGGVENLSPTDNANIRFYGLIFVLVFFGWAGLSRLIRGEVISLRERDVHLGCQGPRCADPEGADQGAPAQPGRTDRDLVVTGPAGLHRCRGRPVLLGCRPDRAHPVLGPDDLQGHGLLPG